MLFRSQRTGKLAERVLKYNWDVTNITGGLIQTQLSEATFKSKYCLRPIPVAYTHLDVDKRQVLNGVIHR